MNALSDEQQQQVLSDIKLRVPGRDAEMFASHLLYAHIMPELCDTLGLYVPKDDDTKKDNNIFYVHVPMYAQYMDIPHNELCGLHNKFDWMEACDDHAIYEYDCYKLRNGIFLSPGRECLFYPVRPCKMSRTNFNAWGVLKLLVSYVIAGTLSSK
jgi:hypothetical protein